MSAGIRYMSDDAEKLKNNLPWYGKKILDKKLTGCGGTEFFGNFGLPLVLVSPRTGVLSNKAGQHPDWHLFRMDNEKNLNNMKARLRNYLDTYYSTTLSWTKKNPVILVTLDSAKYVIEELHFRGIVDNFLFLVDEFQCLMSDSAFKGDVDLNFLRYLNSVAKNICYMSATPIPDNCLDVIPEFRGVPYYELQWDPNIITEPTVKEIMMAKGESPVSIMMKVVQDYRRDGYFAKKVHNGTMVYSKELVVFVNEVKTIQSIIQKCELKPDEVGILISSSSKYVDWFKRNGYIVEGEVPDKDNPINPTFTFCSKASFEGRDFYSNSAFTMIFLDGTKEWQTHDISIEIPQILGRQRKDENPFRYNAVIYFRTKPNVESKEECEKAINKKMNSSKEIIHLYQTSTPSIQESLAEMAKGQDPNNKYKANYLDVVDNPDGTYTLTTNLLVAASEYMLWFNKEYFYSHPIQLSNGVQNQMALLNKKTQALRDFEKKYYAATGFKARMILYCNHLQAFPQDIDALLANPFIEENIHAYYREFGPVALHELSYDERKIQQQYSTNRIIALCKTTFIQGQFYTNGEVKSMLQKIYNNVFLQNPPTAKATDLDVMQQNGLLNVKQVQKTMPDGTRPRGYEFLLP